MKTVAVAVVAVVGLTFLAVGSDVGSEDDTPSKNDGFTQAAINFRSNAAGHTSLCCETTLSFTLGSEDDPMTDRQVTALATVIVEMGFPASVASRMEITRALDGTQTAESNLANIYWTYHPNNGLSVVFEERG